MQMTRVMEAFCLRAGRWGLLVTTLLALLAPHAQAGSLITEFTLESVAPADYSGTLIDNSWTPNDVGALPGFAQVTIDLTPATDYYVGVVAGGWNFRIGDPDQWVNIFFIRDDRGNVPVSFSDPTPFDASATHYATAADALDAATWHGFDVKTFAESGGPIPVPVTFYIYDVDYTDNAGSLTLAIYEGDPPEGAPSMSVAEPASLPLLAIALGGLLFAGKTRRKGA